MSKRTPHLEPGVVINGMKVLYEEMPYPANAKHARYQVLGTVCGHEQSILHYSLLKRTRAESFGCCRPCAQELEASTRVANNKAENDPLVPPRSPALSWPAPPGTRDCVQR